ncbi:MAG: SMC family ATPase [Anaerolineae bacterium]|nr:SMC family ATPase [Anaerolineae bacterium]
MIPVRLELHNFMAYRDPGPLVFEGIHLACLVGENGAGKSTLLDAMTWALWGQTRAGARGEDKLFYLNRLVNDMHVTFDFNLGGQVYRVYRRRERSGRSSRGSLDLMIFDGDQPRIISEPTMSATQRKIDQILRLDYETFINSSLLLQGRADEFTTKRAGERKEVLSNILGLDVWAKYEERAKETIKELENALQLVEGELQRIAQELEREAEYQEELDAAKDRVLATGEALRAVEARWNVVQATRRQRDEAQHRLDDLERRIAQAEADLGRAGDVVAECEARLAGYRALLAERERIEQGYAAWRAAVAQDRELDEHFRADVKLKEQLAGIERRIEVARGALEGDCRVLAERVAEVARQVEAGDRAREQLAGVEAEIAALAADTEVETGYAGWQAAVARERDLGDRLRVYAGLQAQHSALEARIQAARSALESDRRLLDQRIAGVEARVAGADGAQRELETLAVDIDALAAREGELQNLQAEVAARKETRAGLDSENKQLKVEMDELKDRLDRLQAAEGAVCPLCGQDLDEAARLDLVERLAADGKDRGDRYRANEKRIKEIAGEVDALQAEMKAAAADLRRLPDLRARRAVLEAQVMDAAAAQAELATHRADREVLQARLDGADYAPDDHAALHETAAQIDALDYDAETHRAARAEVERLAVFEQRKAALDAARDEQQTAKDRLLEQIAAAEAAGLRLEALREEQAALQKRLDDQDYAHDDQAARAETTAQIGALGYDAAAHAAVRADIARLAVFEVDKARLDEAVKGEQEAEAALGRAQEERDRWQTRLDDERAAAGAVRGELAALEAALHGTEGLEPDLKSRREQHIKANEALGAAQQKVNALEAQRKRRAEQEARREQLAEELSIYKELRAAFGKNGVPTMIIEAAIPEIEDHANQLLGRLTNGQMNLRFSTQREKKSGGAIETLDIIISDTLGERDYEMYSGGEAFRVNFAIRIALSRLLARRAGAQLRTLIIDEGFGSQDTAGRERLVEAINMIKDDFDLIVVITHIEELKDAFPVRIEVEKTPEGSQISVV